MPRLLILPRHQDCQIFPFCRDAKTAEFTTTGKISSIAVNSNTNKTARSVKIAEKTKLATIAKIISVSKTDKIVKIARLPKFSKFHDF